MSFKNSPNKICFISAEKFADIYKGSFGIPYYKPQIHGILKATLPAWKGKFETMPFNTFLSYLQNNQCFEDKYLQMVFFNLLQDYRLQVTRYLTGIEKKYMEEA